MSRWLRAAAGLITLIGLTIGVPLILIRTAGWPLPEAIPAIDDVTTRVRQGNIDSKVVINTLAVVVWIAWAQFMWAVLWETAINVPRLVSGRRWRPPPLVVSPVGDGVARLFSVILAVGVLSTTTPSSTATALSSPSGPVLRDTTPTLVVESTDVTSAAPQAPVASKWHSAADDDLWGIAETALGDGSRVDEIVALNPGLSARTLRGGMAIELPSGAMIPTDRTGVDATQDTLAEAASSDTSTDVVEYVVADNDGMWNVADALLGDGSRHVEAAALLDGQEVAPGVFFDAAAAVIHPGWVFRLDAAASPSTDSASVADEHVVERGESLWEIADENLGDPTRWPEIWDENEGEVMNDGRVFDDPNVVQPNWVLDLPQTAPEAPQVDATPPEVEASIDDGSVVDDVTPVVDEATTAPAPPEVVEGGTADVSTGVDVTADRSDDVSTLPPPSVPATTPAPVPTTSATEVPAISDVTETAVAEVVTVRDRRPVWMLGLTGATALATGLWAAAAWYRRRAGARGGARLRERNESAQLVDEALRASSDQPLLAWTNVALGDLVAQRGINSEGALPLVVKLSAEHGLAVQWEPPLPHDAVPGWQIDSDGRQWRLAPPGADDDLVTPGPVAIPGLATIGRFDGSEVLVDVESCGSLAVTGDPVIGEALIRSLVLELGSGGVLSNAQVHTIGLDIDGAEQLSRVRSRSEADAIEHIRTIRLQHDEVLDTSDRASMLEVRSASSPIGREVTVVVVRAEMCRRLDELIECAAPQRGVAVVVLGDAPCATSLHVDGSRTGVLAPLGLVVEVSGVPRQTAAALAVHLDRVSASIDDDTLAAPVAIEARDDQTWSEPSTLVRVLGVPRIDDVDQLGWRELEIAAFIASNGGSSTDDELIDAVFCGRPDRGAVWDMVSRLRAGAPHVLGSQIEGSNTVSLADGVMSDIAWMEQLVGRSHRRSDAEAIDDLVEALDLVGGSPFDGPGGCEWAITGGDLANTTELIERAAFLATERSIAAGDFDRVRHAINRVMVAVGPNEQLTRTLMRLENAAGNTAGVHNAYGELSLDLSDLSGPSDVVSPTSGTTGLLERRDAEVSVPAPVVERDVTPVRQTVRPRVMLRTFGEVCAEGTPSTQALSVAFVVASAKRAMSGEDLSEVTGYSPKSLSTVFTSGHDIVDREDGKLRLSSGVWTDHGWMLECAQRAERADEAGDVHEVSEWLRSLFAELNRVDGGAFAAPPGKKSYWRWVDDFPADVSARTVAENEMVEAALVGESVWTQAAAEEQLPADVVVRTLTKLAQLVPFAAVPTSIRPDDFASSAESLLLAAHRAAGGRGELINKVQGTARQLVADGAVEPSEPLADALGL